MPHVLLGAILVLNLATLLLYGLDKLAAHGNFARISERTLHLLALAGGWPGALLGQQLFRHKTRKAAFLRRFRLCVALNCALWLALWALLPPGAKRF